MAAERAPAFNPTDLHSVKLHAPAVSAVMTFHVRVNAREVGIDIDLAVDFLPSTHVALDDDYRVFREQFSLLVATAQQRIENQARRRMVEAERDRLLDAPVGAAVMLGQNLDCHLVNSVYAAVSGRPAEQMVNKPFVEVYPELLSSPVHEKFKEVYRSGDARSIVRWTGPGPGPRQERDRITRWPGVDDNHDAASMLAMLLEASGHHVMVENSSRKALERAKQGAPQVCILDIGLPEMDGIELAKRLRALPETASALLVAVTGYGQEQDREQTKAAGF
ncbi:response regulator [Massilia sp. TWR1-2-2]|uniref:response regulator n=1 Tax=Massilia sp. TWR1-2-2 TaxID=2804584 RepID=UPI003CF6A119